MVSWLRVLLFITLTISETAVPDHAGGGGGGGGGGGDRFEHPLLAKVVLNCLVAFSAYFTTPYPQVPLSKRMIKMSHKIPKFPAYITHEALTAILKWFRKWLKLCELHSFDEIEPNEARWCYILTNIMLGLKHEVDWHKSICAWGTMSEKYLTFTYTQHITHLSKHLHTHTCIHQWTQTPTPNLTHTHNITINDNGYFFVHIVAGNAVWQLLCLHTWTPAIKPWKETNKCKKSDNPFL